MARYQLENGPVPLHYQVYLDLRGALTTGEWQPGDRLPTERELAGRYGCSLITVRRALDELAREGRLERGRGRGTFARQPPIARDLATHASFADEMWARGLAPFTRVITARQEAASPIVALGLAVPIGSTVNFLERIRGAAAIPLLLEQAYLSAERFPDLLTLDFEHRSLYDSLEAVYRCPVVRTRETITAFIPTAREARLLGLRPGLPAIQLEGSAFGRDGAPLEYSRTVVSSARAHYYIETSGQRARSVEPFDPGTDGLPSGDLEAVAVGIQEASVPMEGATMESSPRGAANGATATPEPRWEEQDAGGPVHVTARPAGEQEEER